MNTFKKIFYLGFGLILFSSFAYAQNGVIRGKVIESTSGEGAIGATVVLEGTSIAAFTDIDGEFTMEAPFGKHNISISYVGFQKKNISDITINEQKSEIYIENIVLDTDTKVLEEVVQVKPLQ